MTESEKKVHRAHIDRLTAYLARAQAGITEPIVADAWEQGFEAATEWIFRNLGFRQLDLDQARFLCSNGEQANPYKQISGTKPGE